MASDPSLDAFGLQLLPDSPQVVRIRVSKAEVWRREKSEHVAPR